MHSLYSSLRQYNRVQFCDSSTKEATPSRLTIMSAESNEPRSNLIGINREPTNLSMNDLKKFVQMSRLYNAVKAQRKRKKAE